MSWSDDDTLRLWAGDGTLLALLEGHEGRVTGALALADGRLLSWAEDSTLRLWDEDETSVTVLGGIRIMSSARWH